MRISVLLLISVIAVPAEAQKVSAAGLGYGSQSSYQHPMFVTADVGVGIGHGWLVSPAVRLAWNEGRTGLRMQVSLQRRLSTGSIRPYLGLGPSWTNEASDLVWDSSIFGAMGLFGVEARLGNDLWLYGQLDGYTHHYATGQAHLGIRLHR